MEKNVSNAVDGWTEDRAVMFVVNIKTTKENIVSEKKLSHISMDVNYIFYTNKR